MNPSPSRNGECRPVERVDLPRVRVFDAGLASLAQEELQAPRDFAWFGHFVDERVVALHRALRWGSYLHLKGVFVADEFRGTATAIRLALALKSYARLGGWEGVAGWVEPTKPERVLAERLRLHRSGPMVHRIELEFLEGPTPDITEGRSLSGSANFDEGPWLVPDLLGSSGTALHWVRDGGRLVLSGNPCTAVGDLPELLHQLTPLARAVGAGALELPINAASLLDLLGLAARGVKRLSRTPVYLGRHRFRALESALHG